MKIPKLPRPASLVCSFLFVAGLLPHPAWSETNGGLRVYHFGNSHTASTMVAGLEALAQDAGHRGHQSEFATISGASLLFIRDNHEGYRKALESNRYDAIVLQTYNNTTDAEIAAAIEFTRFAQKNNPEIRVILYTIWPGANTDYDNPDLGRSEAWTEKVGAAIEAACPGARVQVAPTSLILRELYPLADSGKLPNITNRFALFSDGGHLGHLGAYAINATICSMLYGEPPFSYHHRMGEKAVPPETATALQQTVWDVLTTYGPAKMASGLTLATRKVPPAVQGQPYAAELKALGADESASWSLLSGRLPPGLELSAEGRLSGTARETGTYDLEIAVAAGGQTARRKLELIVSPDVPPIITTNSLPTMTATRYTTVPLEASGGVGRLKWEVISGDLPHGLRLEEYGTLNGCPGQSGDFPITLQVSDSHPAGSQVATLETVLRVAEMPAEVLRVAMIPGSEAKRRKEDTVGKVDGIFDEPFWDFSHRMEEAISGQPKFRPVFAMAWEESTIRPTFRGLWIGLKIPAVPGADPWKAVGVYWDALNNKEIIFNEDDDHFQVVSSGRRRSIAGFTKEHNMEAKVAQTEEGWNVEIRLRGGAFNGRGAPILFGAQASYGFDLGLIEADGSRSVWFGHDKNDTDPSGWGTIWLAPKPQD